MGKGFAVLRSLGVASGPLTLTAIAKSAGIAASSAHSILNQLADENAVVQDGERRYRLGPATLYLGSAFVHTSSAYRAAWHDLVQAANQHAVTAALAVPDGAVHAVLQSHRVGPSDVAVPMGGQVPLDASSWGKAYYAWSGTSLPASLGRYTPNSITSLEVFQDEVQATRARGYAVDDEEFFEGIGGVCAALTGERGYEGLISFIAPRGSIEGQYDRLGAVIAQLAERASYVLGDAGRVRSFGVKR